MASQIKYDVFVSFRGTDVRDSFLSHLKKEMRQKKVDFFVDNRLQGGDEISDALLKAIEESHISLVIFSKDYVSSRWCLDELVKIIECKDRNKQIVIPVFYNIDPSDVRQQKGTYADAFAKHEENKGNLAKVPNWRSALNIAANLSGFHSSKLGDEAELIEEIVKCLLSKLNLMYQSGSTDLVGIEERIADVESLLRQGSTTDVRVIGIWGMGGIGKTTIAEAVYNRLYCEYDGCSFMANITEESNNHGMIYLKNKILSKLLKEDVQIDTPNEVPFYVKRRLVRMKVLLVLDDINDSEHLGTLHLFGSGSRIIVTTRDKQVLSNKVDNDNIYEAKALSSDEANELFISNAFKENCLDMEWTELSRRVIQYADGNPLALKVLGSSLCGQSKKEWGSQLQKLEKMLDPKIQNKLRLSYDRLDREGKEIFLHIACFFKGFEFKRIEVLLDACGFSTTIGLKVLQDKALIIEAKDFGRRSIVWMHDLIQEMGREIVREECVKDPGQRSRLWDPKDIHQVLKENTGTEAIESITLNVSEFDELCLGPRVFARVQQLKFLEVTRSNGLEPILNFPDGLEYLPNDLRLLSWDSYPLKSLPQSFCAENLVELKMTSSRAEKLWDGIQNLQNLKKIDLSYSENLLELPDFSKASNLEVVTFYGCKNLRNVHPSILSLNKLVQLNLLFCEALTSLRSETHLRSLRGLEEFSVTSENLEVLGLRSTAIIEPASIKHLSKLKLLDIGGCTRLCHLPVLPPSITKLYVDNCSPLETVMFTSRAAELLQADDYMRIQFQNCGKLDEHSLSAIGINAHANMKKFAYENLSTTVLRRKPPHVIYPGSEVPEWFMYKTTQASITIDLSWAPPSKFMGFIFCAIIVGPSLSEGTKYIRCDYTMDTGNDERVVFWRYSNHSSMSYSEKVLSDHVFMWYDKGQLLAFQNGSMKEVMAHYNSKFLFQFSAYSDWNLSEKIMIKGCGVCPLYNIEFQFQFQLESTSQSIATKMSVACSDEKESLAPKPECKKFFPPLQIGTWKSATQGLKDILPLGFS